MPRSRDSYQPAFLQQHWKENLRMVKSARLTTPLYSTLQDFIPYIACMESIAVPKAPRETEGLIFSRFCDWIIPSRSPESERFKVVKRFFEHHLKTQFRKPRPTRLKLQHIPIEITSKGFISFGPEDLERLRVAAKIFDGELARFLRPYWSAIARAKQSYHLQVWSLLFSRPSSRQRELFAWCHLIKRENSEELERLFWICYIVHEIVTIHRAVRLSWSDLYNTKVRTEIQRLNLEINKVTTGEAKREELKRRRLFFQGLTKSQSMFKASLEKSILHDAALIIIEEHLLPSTNGDPDQVFKDVARFFQIWNPEAKPINPRSLKHIANGDRTRHLTLGSRLVKKPLIDFSRAAKVGLASRSNT